MTEHQAIDIFTRTVMSDTDGEECALVRFAYSGKDVAQAFKMAIEALQNQHDTKRDKILESDTNVIQASILEEIRGIRSILEHELCYPRATPTEMVEDMEAMT